MTRDEIRRQLQDVFRRHLTASSTAIEGLVPPSASEGKLYEAHILSRVVEQLAVRDGYSLVLVGGAKVRLKSAPGPINRAYPRIELHRSGNCVAELWTDVEFLSLSYCGSSPRAVTKGDYHELDIVIVNAGITGRPRFDAIWLAIECKNTGYEKDLLKAILGIRRELSLLDGVQPTRFDSWPRKSVPANPASCLLVYSTDPKVVDYSAPGAFFGIDFAYEPM